MIAAIHCIFIFGLAWWVSKKFAKEYTGIFWLGLVVKLVMGSALGLVYLYYYTANDTWLFFQDANALADFGRKDIVSYFEFLFNDIAHNDLTDGLVNNQERSIFLIKIMSVFSWIGGNNYWVSVSWFSFISFLAAWYLFLIVAKQFEHSRLAAAIAFLFFPSVVFWSSGLVKETMALAGIYFISGLFLKFIFDQKAKWSEWLLALYGFWIAWNLKYYWAALFGAVLFTHVLIYVLSKRSTFIQQYKIVVWIVSFVVLCGGVSLLHPNFYLSRFLEVLITNHNDFVRISHDSGLIHYYQLEAWWGSVILNAPWALFSGLLRPFVWEASGLMALLAALENLLITVLLITAVSRVFKVSANRLLLLSVLMYIVLLCIFLALSTPNFGTLSRYRVGFLPFLIFIISYRNPLLSYLSKRIQFLQS